MLKGKYLSPITEAERLSMLKCGSDESESNQFILKNTDSVSLNYNADGLDFIDSAVKKHGFRMLSAQCNFSSSLSHATRVISEQYSSFIPVLCSMCSSGARGMLDLSSTPPELLSQVDDMLSMLHNSGVLSTVEKSSDTAVEYEFSKGVIELMAQRWHLGILAARIMARMIGSDMNIGIVYDTHLLSVASGRIDYVCVLISANGKLYAVMPANNTAPAGVEKTFYAPENLIQFIAEADSVARHITETIIESEDTAASEE